MLTYNVPMSSVNITFYNYRRTISSIDMSTCILSATQDCVERIPDWDRPLGPNGKVYGFGSVQLLRYPYEDMTWGGWSNGVRGLSWFLAVYEAVDLSFRIMVGEQGTVGIGQFTSMDTNATLPSNATLLTSLK
jgi:hypothetical protein